MNAQRRLLFAMGIWLLGIVVIWLLIWNVENMGVEVPWLIQACIAGAWGWFIGWHTD